MLVLRSVVPTTTDVGGSNEPIQKAITHVMALPLPFCMGAEISIQDIDRERFRRGGTLHTRVFSTTGGRCFGIEYPKGSRASSGHGASKGINLKFCWDAEGENRDKGIQQVSRVEALPVLGQSFLGTGILRRHGGFGRDEDPHVRAVPREAGEDCPTTRVRLLTTSRPWGQRLSLPPSGARQFNPLQGVNPMPPPQAVDSLSWGTGRFGSKLGPRLHFHLGPGRAVMRHHLPYQFNTWRHHASAVTKRWLFK